LWYIRYLQPNAIKAIGDVDLRHVYGPVSGIGVDNISQNALERSPKLHGFTRCQEDGLAVNAGEGVIND
jgi:hypothetical protein